MPDGYNMGGPENSSIDFMRSVGAVPKPEGPQTIPQPKSQTGLPYATVELPPPIPGTVYGSDKDRLKQQIQQGNISESVLAVTNPVDIVGSLPVPDRDPRADNEAYLRQRSVQESSNDVMLKSAKRPFELYFALRRIFSRLESGTIPPGYQENYRPPSQLTGMIERMDDLTLTGQTMIDYGFLYRYDPKTGLGIPTEHEFEIMAFRTDPIRAKVSIQTGEITRVIDPREDYDVFAYDYATSETRAEMAQTYERAIPEMEARGILGELVGARLSLAGRDDLNRLVNYLHETGAKFQPEHLIALFNAPALDALRSQDKSRSKDRTLGDQIEEGMVLNLIMLNSGTKKRMSAFMERPGVKHLIAKMAREEEARTGNPYTYDMWVEDNIGDYKHWVDDENRYLTKEDDASGVTHIATFQEEADLASELNRGRAKALRGRLTQHGNIAAFGGEPGDMGKDTETQFIEKIMGRLCGSVEASWLASSMMKATGAYASEGYDELPDNAIAINKSLLPLGEGRFIGSDDTGKFYGYMFNFKEGIRNRSSGLKDMLGRIPDLAMNLFDWAQVRVDGVLDKNGKPVKRSVWDAWLGTAGGMHIKDILTGEDALDEHGNFKLTKEEGYHRLGDLNFMSLDRDFQGTYGIMMWLNGRDDSGVWTEAMNVEKFGPESFTLNELKKKRKYMGITMNAITLTKGSPHLYDLGGQVKEKYVTYNVSDKQNDTSAEFSYTESTCKKIEAIQHRYFMNLMAARIRSAHFVQNIFLRDNEAPNSGVLGRKENRVPITNLIRGFIAEANQPAPKNLQQLFNHYIDSLKKLTSDVMIRLKDAPELHRVSKEWLTNDVGIVRGRGRALARLVR